VTIMTGPHSGGQLAGFTHLLLRGAIGMNFSTAIAIGWGVHMNTRDTVTRGRWSGWC